MSDPSMWGTVIGQTVANAQRTAQTTRSVPGNVVDVAGEECNVEPSDAPGTLVPATRMHPDIVAGTKVKLIFWGDGSTDAYGPIPS